MNIIALAGRMRSGKTELAKVCEKHGYEILSFATPLKKMVAKLVGKNSIDELNKDKEKYCEYILDDASIDYLTNEIEIPRDIIKKFVDSNKFTTIRQLLQGIGTNLIRKNQPEWHVKKLKELILTYPDDSRICLDDLRFPNEKEMIKELGGICFFVIRPDNLSISNHESETSLTLDDFREENVIINDMSLAELTFYWNECLNEGLLSNHINNKSVACFNIFSEVRKIRIYHIGHEHFYCNKEAFRDESGDLVLKKIRPKQNTIQWDLDNKFINFWYYSTTNNKIDNVYEENLAYLKLICHYVHIPTKHIEYIDNNLKLTIKNPFVIENLKMYFELFESNTLKNNE